MTMKTKKTLQHIATVAAVLLTFCLVFMMPVGAVDISSVTEGKYIISTPGDYVITSSLTGDIIVTDPTSVKLTANPGIYLSGNVKDSQGNILLYPGVNMTNAYWPDSHVAHHGDGFENHVHEKPLIIKEGGSYLLTTSYKGDIVLYDGTNYDSSYKGKKDSDFVGGIPRDWSYKHILTNAETPDKEVSLKPLTQDVILSGSVRIEAWMSLYMEGMSISLEESNRNSASHTLPAVYTFEAANWGIDYLTNIKVVLIGNKVTFADTVGADSYLFCADDCQTAISADSEFKNNVVTGVTGHFIQINGVASSGTIEVSGNTVTMDAEHDDKRGFVKLDGNPTTDLTILIKDNSVTVSGENKDSFSLIRVDGSYMDEAEHADEISVELTGNTFTDGTSPLSLYYQSKSGPVTVSQLNSVLFKDESENLLLTPGQDMTGLTWDGDATNGYKLSVFSAAGTYKLTADITVGAPITISNDVTIDLNGKTITADYTATDRLFKVTEDATLTITDSGEAGTIKTNKGAVLVQGGTFDFQDGTIEDTTVITERNRAIIRADGSETENSDDYSVVTIGENAVIKADASYAILASGKYDGVSAGVEITVAGTITTPSGITTNGGMNRNLAEGVYSLKPDVTYPEITITESAKITATSGPAIYAAGYATWNIAAGAQLSGEEALGIKSGVFNINGGTFTANGAYADPASMYNNGPESTGAAISITSNDAYPGGVAVTINDGAFESTNGHAVYEGVGYKACSCTGDNPTHAECINVNGHYFVKESEDVAKKASTDSHLTSITIEKGNFKSASGKEVILLTTASDMKNFINAGLFSAEIHNADYIASNVFSVANLDTATKATYPFAVDKKEYIISIGEVGFDSVKVGYTQPVAKEVTITNKGNTPFTFTATTHENYVITVPNTILAADGGSAVVTVQPKAGLPVGNYADTIKVNTDVEGVTADIDVSFLVYQPSSGGSSTTKPEEPVEPETPVEPENPTEEPEAGEPTVETEVTDGGEVLFEEPVAPETPGADTPSDEPAEPTVTGVELPAGTDSEVAFIPVSEKPAPAGKETQTKKVFEINIPKYEKGKPATVKFTMTVAELAADGKTAADVALWHQDEETGEWTKLVTTFVIIDGVVYFEAITFDFSPFAIVYEDVSAPTEPETPEQPTESPAPILAVLAGLGAAVVLRRK